jgi:hypothetical protein
MRSLGVNARSFFTGLWEASFGLGARSAVAKNISS